MGLQHAQREILELIVDLRAKPTPTPTTPVSDGLAQGVSPTNVDNLSVAGQSVSVAEEPATLLTCSDIKALADKRRTHKPSWTGSHHTLPR